MYALKKFTGGLGDDDDRESGDKLVWQKYFTKSIEEAKIVVATRKVHVLRCILHCESAQLSAFWSGMGMGMGMVWEKEMVLVFIFTM